MQTILTVEDNVETQILLKNALEGRYHVLASYNLASARSYISTHKINLIILDLILPDGYGMDLFNELCAGNHVSKIPIIILSTQDDIISKVKGLQSGADDYIAKPFERQELLARVDSVLRRGPTRHTESTLTISDVCLNLNKQAAYQIKAQGLFDLCLTPIEFKILLFMSQHHEVETSREVIRTNIWGSSFITERNVDTHISKLRKKLLCTNLEINNKRSHGYILQETQAPIKKSIEMQTYELPAYGRNNKSLYV